MAFHVTAETPWRHLSDRELETLYLNACAEHFQWRLDNTRIQDGELNIEGWALTTRVRPGDARFLINGREFDIIQYPLPSADIGSIFWNVPTAHHARFKCKTRIDWQESFPDGFARLEFQDGSKANQVRRRAWYLPNPRIELPLPEAFRIRRVIGVPDPENYLIGGAAIYKRLEDYLRENHSKTFDDFSDILDWACGCGRVARNFRWCRSRFIGADIDGDNIAWCRQHLPHGQFLQSAVMPPLPFAAASFDLILAVSILDQIDLEHQMAWLRELQRLLKNKGLLLVSVVGLTQIGLARPNPDLMRRIEEERFLVTSRNSDLDDVMPHLTHYVSGIHSREYLKEILEKHFEVLDIVDAIVANDDLIVLKNHGSTSSFLSPVKLAEEPAVENPFALPLRDYDLNPFIHPTMAKSGYGGHMIGIDGKDYVDFMSAWGTNLLGYGYRKVARAVARQARSFSGLGMPYPQFYELRDLLCRLIPSAEDVRYGKNGSDACAGAVRLARHLTNREKILYHGYHGFHDWYFASTDCPGIPVALKETVVSQEQLTPQAVHAAFQRQKDQIAAIIMNPLTPPIPSADQIREIIEVVHGHGGLVIFDEMFSGFRVAVGGMQEVWGVQPDLSCFGKSIANGLPLAVLCGRGDYIRRLPEPYYGMTFEGEAVSIAAAHATLTEVIEKKVVGALFEKGRKIRTAYDRIAQSYELRTSLTGYEPCMTMGFRDQNGVQGRQLLWLMIQELTRNRIFTLGAFILCFSHNNRDLKKLELAADAAMNVVRRAVERGSTEGLLDERTRLRMDEITAPANWRRGE